MDLVIDWNSLWGAPMYRPTAVGWLLRADATCGSRHCAPVIPTSADGWVSVVPIADDSAERACGWSPDGRLLYLLLERDGFRDLYAQRVDAARGSPVGDPFVVQHLHEPQAALGIDARDAPS